MSLQGVFKPAESPFFGILEQNRLPSRHEKKAIQELVVKKTAHLAQLKSQVPKRRVGKKRSVPSEVRADIAYTRRWLEFHRALISPWRRLPAEIMSEIFLFTLKPRGQGLSPRDLWDDDRAGTLLVCKICTSWRAIALRTPALWNTLSIRLLTERRARPKAVSMWLERSRSSPVHLQLVWSSQASAGGVNSVMHVFARHFYHTAELFINGLYSMRPRMSHWGQQVYPPLTFRPSVESLNAPLLSTFVVHLSEGSVWKWMDPISRTARCLSHLTTSHASLDLFPLANLTQLNWIHQAPMAQIFRIFEDAPNLKHVNLHAVGPVVTSSTDSRLTMRSITTLELTSHQHLGKFLDESEFPNIVNLRICDVDTWPGPSLHSFLSRSASALTALAFRNCRISAAEILACLQDNACNTLQSLSVESCDPRNGEALLRYLTYRGPEHPCANPSLQSITLHGIRAPDGPLADMVQSRCPADLPGGAPGPVRLIKIAFSFVDIVRRTDHAEDRKRLRELEREGKLKIGWPARVSPV